MVTTEQLRVWQITYIDMLHRFQLWVPAAELMNVSEDDKVRGYVGNTVVKAFCGACRKELDADTDGDGLDPGRQRCLTCLNKASSQNESIWYVGRPVDCAICQLPVRGAYVWCQGCGHGGHFECMKEWFSTQAFCPTGCGHECQMDWSTAQSLRGGSMTSMYDAMDVLCEGDSLVPADDEVSRVCLPDVTATDFF